MPAKGKAPKVLIALARVEPVADLPEGRWDRKAPRKWMKGGLTWHGW